MSQKLSNWLAEKVDPYTTEYYEPPIKKYSTAGVYKDTNFMKYYTNTDVEIGNSKEVVAATINAIKYGCYDTDNVAVLKAIETYGPSNSGQQVVIPQNSKLAHANYLFKRLIDVTESKELSVEVVETDRRTGTVSYVNAPIFDKSMKEKFYSFCMQNTEKSK
jgi:hypothetical protein